MMGVERPPYGAFQARFSPLSDHFSGRPFSLETPSRSGPRQSGQSPTVPICWARVREASVRRRIAGFCSIGFVSGLDTWVHTKDSTPRYNLPLCRVKAAAL